MRESNQPKMRNQKDNIACENAINRIMAFIEANPILILSTSVKNRIYSRPIGSFKHIKGYIYFTMNNNKPLFSQLKTNPHICICACGADYTWLRIYAKAKVCESIEIKMFFIKQGFTRFSDINDPLFTIIKLDEMEAEIHKMGEIEVFRI